MARFGTIRWGELWQGVRGSARRCMVMVVQGMAWVSWCNSRLSQVVLGGAVWGMDIKEKRNGKDSIN